MNDLLLSSFRSFSLKYQTLDAVYKTSPEAFDQAFGSLVDKMDPKVVRAVCYFLYSNGLRNPIKTETLPKVPSETLLVLLKYKVPVRSNGRFFLNLNSDLKWFSRALDFISALDIDLNTPNPDGLNLLDRALLKQDSLKVEELLSHGAKTTSVEDPRLTVTPFDPGLLSDLDFIEDLAVIAQVDPDILYDRKFQELFSENFLILLRDSVKNESSQVILVDNKTLEWPFYSDVSVKPIEFPEEFQVTVDPPPSTEILNTYVQYL